jgi:hypothetical protein
MQAGILLIVAAAQLLAQATDGNVAGSVRDPSGQAVPGATLRAANRDTAFAYTTTTGADGGYRLQNLPSGTYDIAAIATGFNRSVIRGVVVRLNQTTTVNLALELGSVTTRVEVREAAAPIDTTTSQIASTWDTREIDGLPASFAPMGTLNLALLAPGVASGGGLGVGDGPSVGGQRPRSNNFTIEGVDNNRKDVTGRNVEAPADAVAETTVLQNQFSAEFGHSPGGQFNVILKGGTNELHGSGYEYLRNRKLNALDVALARQGMQSNPRYDSSVAGGTLGGPVVSNRLFYFGDFEYNPTGRESAASSATMAPTEEGYGRLAAIPGVSATNLKVLRTYLGAAPEASANVVVAGVEAPAGALPFVAPSYDNGYTGVGSVDWNISNRDQARGRFIERHSAGLDPETAAGLPAFNQARNTTAMAVSASEFHSFTPQWTNELRLAYNRFADRIPAGDQRFPGLDTFPTITIQEDLNTSIGPFSQAPQATLANTLQLVNNTTHTVGRHTVTFGVDFRKYTGSMNFNPKVRGEYTYSTLARYLMDLNPDVTADRNTGSEPFSTDQVSAYGFVNDEFRIRPNVTVLAGLRYEYPGMAAGLKDQALNAASGVPGLISFGEPERPTKNFAPRVGVAWSPGRAGTTSLRAGFGLAYDAFFDNIGANTRPPQLQTAASEDIRQSVPGFLAGGAIRANAAPPAMSVAEARQRTAYLVPNQLSPYAAQWNLGFTRVLARDYTVEVRYLGTRGVHLINQSRINVQSVVTAAANLPTYLSRPSQAELDGLQNSLEALKTRSYVAAPFAAAGFTSPITSYLPRGNSFYHGLAAEVARRFSHGLLFRGAYTWSHAIDDSTADVASTLLSPRRPQDFGDMRLERGSSMLDRRQRFTMSGVWNVPFGATAKNAAVRGMAGGWTLAATYMAESPAYATVQSGVDSNLNGDSAADRAIVNPAGQDGKGSDVTALKNSAGQTVAYLAVNPSARYIKAAAGAYANAGRNTLPLVGINNFDVSAVKRVRIREGVSAELRVMFFNAANHPQFTPGSVNTVMAVPRPATRNNLIPGNPAFGDCSRVFESNARTATVALRVVF